jgi:HEAT repeat protein
VAGDPAADLALRRDAVEALAAFETEEATEALRGLLGADDTYVQEVARRAIAARR